MRHFCISAYLNLAPMTRPTSPFATGLTPHRQLGINHLGLFDPHPRSTLDEVHLHSRAGYSPWHGYPIQGEVVRTISRGRTVYLRGELRPDFTHGAFVPRTKWSASAGATAEW